MESNHTPRGDQRFKVRGALLLDMDGTIRRSKSGTFVSGPDDIELMPGIEPIIWHYKNNGYLIFIVSNQGGVAHGHKSTERVMEELMATVKLFKMNPFDGARICPFMEDGIVFPYNHRSMYRKPEIGMLALLEYEAFHKGGFMIDWNNSLMVGDRPEDVQLAANARISYMDIQDFLKLEV